MSGVCLLSGVGPGTGTSLVRRFAAGGYEVAMLARNAERLEALAGEIPSAHAFPCDLVDGDAIREVVGRVTRDLGAPTIIIHNAVGGAFGNYMAITPELLRHNFEVNTMALLHLAQATLPSMIEAGEGALLCTGNTSAHRGRAGFAGFAPTKAAQRILCESIARDAGPQGVHVAYITIDAVIDLEWTRQMSPDRPDDAFIQPDDIAAECFHIAHQPRSAWSFHVEIRPHREEW